METRSARRVVNISCIVAAIVVGVSSLAHPAQAQSRDRRNDARTDMSQGDSFNWSGTIADGHSIIIKNINGPIRVEHSNTNRVEVTAEKRWRGGNPADVRVVQPSIDGNDIVICALWSDDATCDERGIHAPRNSGRNNNRNNDVSVHFVVRVPNGVRVNIETVNGSLDIKGGDNDVDAATVNGTISAQAAGGAVRARTVNGNINIGMTNVRSVDDLTYETVNGSVTLEMPATFGAQLELSTVNGRVTTDFPVTVVGTISARKLRGTVGNGSARVRATTVNGSIILRRSN